MPPGRIHQGQRMGIDRARRAPCGAVSMEAPGGGILTPCCSWLAEPHRRPDEEHGSPGYESINKGHSRPPSSTSTSSWLFQVLIFLIKSPLARLGACFFTLFLVTSVVTLKKSLAADALDGNSWADQQQQRVAQLELALNQAQQEDADALAVLQTAQSAVDHHNEGLRGLEQELRNEMKLRDQLYQRVQSLNNRRMAVIPNARVKAAVANKAQSTSLGVYNKQYTASLEKVSNIQQQIVNEKSKAPDSVGRTLNPRGQLHLFPSLQ
mmetsp:Transcript_20927/g.66297  ORF Transcript_20927/g.66297 Transcript_20927/m.66297 type:complete len:266 (+) Transcript_20927:260-1057(+)